LVPDGSLPRSLGSAGGSLAVPASSASPQWGPQMWAIIDKEMTLKDCMIFSYQPVEDPFYEEEGTIWSLHYFFVNLTLKRVAYLYVRAIPVMSHSPRLHPYHGTMKRSSFSGDGGPNKRAKYWLGDDYAECISAPYEDMDDGLIWDRDEDGNFTKFCEHEDDDYDCYDEESEEDDGDAEGEEEDEDGDEDGAEKSPIRGVSEDIAARMDVE